MPNYRFAGCYAQAMDFCSAVRAYGSSLQAALEKAEKQALRHQARERTLKRVPVRQEVAAKRVETARPRKAKPLVAPEDAMPSGPPVAGQKPGRTLPVVLHSFPTAQPIAEPHIVRSQEAVSVTPMTIEEAVKEAEFRDREVLVFRNLAGVLHVLYRKRDGKMALIEVP